MINLDFLSKMHSSDDEGLFVVKEGTISPEDISGASSLKVDSNNFDVAIRKATNGAMSYSLFIKEGFTIEHVDFSITIESDKILIKVLTKKNNLYGRLKISIPTNIEGFWIDVVNGDIGTNGITMSLAEFHTVNGDINLCVTDNAYHITTKATNGDISNAIRNSPKSNNSIICSAVNGDINIVKG